MFCTVAIWVIVLTRDIVQVKKALGKKPPLLLADIPRRVNLKMPTSDPGIKLRCFSLILEELGRKGKQRGI